jgi:hypothetical protein
LKIKPGFIEDDVSPRDPNRVKAWQLYISSGSEEFAKSDKLVLNQIIRSFIAKRQWLLLTGESQNPSDASSSARNFGHASSTSPDTSPP